MKVFLVVIAVWDMAYKGIQLTPSLVQEMPSIEACKAVAQIIIDQTSVKGYGSSKATCVEIK